MLSLMNITSRVARPVPTAVLDAIKFVFLAARQAAFATKDTFEMGRVTMTTMDWEIAFPSNNVHHQFTMNNSSYD